MGGGGGDVYDRALRKREEGDRWCWALEYLRAIVLQAGAMGEAVRILLESVPGTRVAVFEQEHRVDDRDDRRIRRLPYRAEVSPLREQVIHPPTVPSPSPPPVSPRGRPRSRGSPSAMPVPRQSDSLEQGGAGAFATTRTRDSSVHRRG